MRDFGFRDTSIIKFELWRVYLTYYFVKIYINNV